MFTSNLGWNSQEFKNKNTKSTAMGSDFPNFFSSFHFNMNEKNGTLFMLFAMVRYGMARLRYRCSLRHYGLWKAHAIPIEVNGINLKVQWHSKCRTFLRIYWYLNGLCIFIYTYNCAPENVSKNLTLYSDGK